MISIIVPVLNEEKTIETALKRLNGLDGHKEIIVVDGGSMDRTREIAAKFAPVYKSSPGRARQMNLGAEMAKGDILWFVHSDSIVDETSIRDIEEAIDEGNIGGGLQLYFYDLDSLFMKFVSSSSNLRAKYLGLFYGDQGIFVRTDMFSKLKGYPDIPIMEDWEFSLTLKKHGSLKLVDSRIGTSARRFKTGGEFRTLMLMHKIKFLHVIGVSPDRIAKIYKEAR
jgi:rSAM/selenodomain-associated transferase 2